MKLKKEPLRQDIPAPKHMASIHFILVHDSTAEFENLVHMLASNCPW